MAANQLGEETTGFRSASQTSLGSLMSSALSPDEVGYLPAYLSLDEENVGTNYLQKANGCMYLLASQACRR